MVSFFTKNLYHDNDLNRSRKVYKGDIAMYPRLLHIYGPLWINSYGVMIALGFLTFLYFSYHDPKRSKLISGDLYFNVLFFGLTAGIIGGRLLFVITDLETFIDNPIKIFYVWEGGFVVLGSIIGVLISIPFYLAWHKINILKLFDLAAEYAPLLQSIARLGCLCAGCCYGIPAPHLPWAITFTNIDCMDAPLHIPLHPTQLYLSLSSLCIFLLLHYVIKYVTTRPGQLICIYLTLESFARFFIDFLRGDRGQLKEVFVTNCVSFILSTAQIFSGTFFVLCLLGLIIVSHRKTKS